VPRLAGTFPAGGFRHLAQRYPERQLAQAMAAVSSAFNWRSVTISIVSSDTPLPLRGLSMSFKVTKELVKEALEDDPSLQTITNQFTFEEIWDMIEDKDQIKNDDQLFEALMDVMYSTRPQGDF
jgi:hypothetical protein